MRMITGLSGTLWSLLFWSAPLWAAGAEGGGSSLDFVWKVANTAILIGILYYFARKPVSEALSKSAAEAKATIEEARQAEQKIEAELVKAKEKLANMEQETAAMVEKAKGTAEAERQRILAEGEAEVARMTASARFSIEQEFKKAEYDLRRWVAGATVELAEQKLHGRVNAEQQKKLVQNFVDSLPSGGNQ